MNSHLAIINLRVVILKQLQPASFKGVEFGT